MQLYLKNPLPRDLWKIILIQQSQTSILKKEQDDSYAVAMKKDSKELKEAVDKTIQKLKESGELDKLIEDAFKASIEKQKEGKEHE